MNQTLKSLQDVAQAAPPPRLLLPSWGPIPSRQLRGGIHRRHWNFTDLNVTNKIETKEWMMTSSWKYRAALQATKQRIIRPLDASPLTAAWHIFKKWRLNAVYCICISSVQTRRVHSCIVTQVSLIVQSWTIPFHSIIDETPLNQSPI
jgi:hypothetical protein